MTDIKIFDKIIPQGYADAIEDDLLRREFPWHYIDDVTNPDYGNNSGFLHLAYDFGAKPSEWYPFIKPLVFSIAEANGRPLEKLLRIRIGFLPKTDEPEHTCNTPHVDFLYPHYTACYYVSDSDGDTVMFDQQLKDVGTNINTDSLREFVENTEFTEAGRCSPKKGRLCIFDGQRFHASSKPKQHKRRLVITVNYI
jgi:hypothetical protein